MRPRTAAVAIIKRVITGCVSVWTSFVYVAFHTASEAGFTDWTTASGVFISRTASQALYFVRGSIIHGEELEVRTI